MRNVNKIEEIPFLPIEFFKTEKVLCENIKSAHHFLSSGTTSKSQSIHYVECLDFYERNILNCFETFWGDSSKYCFLCNTKQKKCSKFFTCAYVRISYQPYKKKW